MRIDPFKLPPRYQEQINRALKRDRGKSPDSVPDVESGVGHAPETAHEAKTPDTRYHVEVLSRRNRLCDQDNLCAKYIIDGIVRLGLLPDDDPKTVVSYTTRQEKVGRKEEETIVTIYPVPPEALS